jgi:GT2 family glycosyltransferase
MRKKVGLIMINYKKYAERFLRESYNSLMQVNYPHDSFCLYIVDNLSSSETLSLCKKLAPEAKVIPSKGNGWGHANNVGARQAIQDGCDYLFFLNMDTEFDSEFIQEAITVYESDKNIGLVQSKLLLHPPVDGEYMLNSAGNSMTFLGFGYCAGDGKKDNVENKVSDITYASGAGVLISRENWEKIGECDESYFMYHDDAEISFKIKLLGKRVVLAPKSIVYHKHEFGRSIMQVTFMERNRIRFLLEFLKLPTLILIFPAFLLMELGMFPYVVLNKWTKAKLKVYFWFLVPKNFHLVLKKRKEIQKLRKISDKKLMKGMTGVIDFQQIENPVLKYIANPFFAFYWWIIKKVIFW